MSSLQRLVRHAAMTLIGYLTVASASYAAQPPDVVKSDSNANTAMGSSALFNLTTGAQNTAAGVSALVDNTTGKYNSAFGAFSLGRNTTGVWNSAFGAYALVHNTDGNFNTAVGFEALTFNGIGYWDTAVGAAALRTNSGGAYNSAFGVEALYANQTGLYNTALGVSALYSNSTGNNNTAAGVNSLEANTTGSNNTAHGFQSLHVNTLGHGNTALGYQALLSNTTGSANIGVGVDAGSSVTSGSNNIHIGATGSSGDNAKIRIGTQGTQTGTYIAGISGTHVTGAVVYITSSGQLGVLASSERYKTQVTSMGSSTTKLTQLRPVTFRLKNGRAAEVQYGLIAEEVARVYPELVIRDNKGRIQGVRYEELAPMLLNEVQKQAKVIDALTARLTKLEEQQVHGSPVIDSH